jgi:hypothetical protein
MTIRKRKPILRKKKVGGKNPHLVAISRKIFSDPFDKLFLSRMGASRYVIPKDP